jgi:hypothetical protein
MISEIAKEWSKPLIDSMKGMVTPHSTSNRIDRYVTETVTRCQELAKIQFGKVPVPISKQADSVLDLIKRRNYMPL